MFYSGRYGDLIYVSEIYLGILTRIEMISDGIKYIKASRRSPLKIKETQN